MPVSWLQHSPSKISENILFQLVAERMGSSDQNLTLYCYVTTHSMTELRFHTSCIDWSVSRPTALKHCFMEMHICSLITLEFSTFYHNMIQWLNIDCLISILVIPNTAVTKDNGKAVGIVQMLNEYQLNSEWICVLLNRTLYT